MKSKIKIKSLIVCSLGGLLLSCASEGEVDPLAELTKQEQTKQVQVSDVKLSKEEFYVLIQSIPSPLQSTAMMEMNGIEYDEGVLSSTDNTSQYGSWFSQSVNLGIYGADMGYANVYGETKTSMDYVGSIRDLADQLKVGQFFDISTIKELASKKNDIDALINASQINFQKMNDYLQTQNRGKVSVAMVFGGWLESLYITSTIATQNAKSQDLREIVAEQKLSIEVIETLLSLYSSDDDYKDLALKFDKLKTAFDDIKMVYHEGEVTEVEDEDGNLTIEDTSSTEIIVTAEHVQAIAKVVTEIRKDLINLK